MSSQLVLAQEQAAVLTDALTKSTTKINLPAQALAHLVFQRISTKSAEPTVLQVIEVAKTALDMGLDPTSKDVYAFLNKSGVLTVGVSKGGWEKAVESKGGSFTYQLGDVIPGTPSRLSWAKCVIRRKDGSTVEGIPAFDDECNTGLGVWATKPKHMLMVRAFTNAAKAAYGFGAYSIEEAMEVFNEGSAAPQPVEVKPIEPEPQVELPKPEVPQEELDKAINGMEGINDIQELRKYFISVPREIREHPAFREASIKKSEILKEGK